VPGGPQLANKLGVELIHAGKWRVLSGEWEATPACLASAVDAQSCPAVRPPVLKLGHSDKRFDGDPALGWVQKLRLANAGKTLVGDFVGMPAALNQIMATAYPDRSVEGAYNYRCAAGHAHEFVLTAVALLGVTPPGIATLKSFRDVAQMYGLAASAAPVLGGTPVVVTIRASGPSPSTAPADVSAPSQTGSNTIMGTPRAASAQIKASLASGVADGRITKTTSDDWIGKVESGEWSESLVERTLRIMSPRSVVTASSALPPDTRDVIAEAHRVLAEAKAVMARQVVPAAVTASAARPAVAGPQYALNPLMEQVMASSPSTYRHGVAVEPAPTLFRSGDLPVYTASGIDPQTLLKVPWMARHPIAAAKTLVEAKDLIEFVSGPDGEDNARAEGMGLHPGNRDYQMRVNHWLTDAGRHAAEAAQQVEDKRIAASAGMAKAPHEMTDDECYDALFGHLDRQAEARRRADEDAVMAGTAWGHGYSADQILALRQRRVAAGAPGPQQEIWELYHPAAPPQGARVNNTSRSIDYARIVEGDK
jgi:hypothetical protein